MQSDNRILDDMARVTGGAIGALAGIRREIEAQVRHQLERLLSGMDLVTRDEFEAVRAMAEKARAEQEDLTAKIAALEAALQTAGGAPAAEPRPKIAAEPRPKMAAKPRTNTAAEPRTETAASTAAKTPPKERKSVKGDGSAKPRAKKTAAKPVEE